MTFTDLEIVTPRLRLRTPVATDAVALQAVVADPRVALTTASIPHPYPDDGAWDFIRHVRRIAGPTQRNLAIVLPGNDELIGMVGFGPVGPDAELAYMLSPRYWGHGFATEAAGRLVAYIFEKTTFPSIIAKAMKSNPASAVVLRKVGFREDGEADVELPTRGGHFRTTFWRLDAITWSSPA
jgi:ribosomal-protein-alanine N-acetyltransferase